MPSDTIELPSIAETAAPEPERPPRRAGYGVLPVLITLLAAFMRLHGLAYKSFWMDEGMSVEYARLPWAVFLKTLWNREANMALYYILLRYWLLLGRSDGFVRGLSVIFSVATVPVLYLLAKRLFDRQTAIVAAFLLAIHAYHIRYAQEARGYALVVFLSVLASWLLVRNLQEPSSSHWGIYTAVCVLAVYTHFYAGLMIVAHLVSLAWPPRKEVPWRTIARHMSYFACWMIPIAIFVVRIGTEPINWVQPVGRQGLLYLGLQLSGNYGKPLLILVSLLLGVALVSARRARLAGEDTKFWSYAFLFSWLFVPIVTVLTASLIHPLLVNRYMSPFFPALIVLLSSAVMAFRPRVLGLPFFFAISVCLILGTASYYQRDFDVTRQDWRVAADYVARNARPGDSIFFYQGGAQPPFDFYYRWQKDPPAVWPKSLNPSYSAEGNGVEYESIPGTPVRAAIPVGNRVWLVFLLPEGPNGMPDMTGIKIRDWFSKGRERIAVQRLYPIDILLLASPERTLNEKAGQ